MGHPVKRAKKCMYRFSVTYVPEPLMGRELINWQNPRAKRFLLGRPKYLKWTGLFYIV